MLDNTKFSITDISIINRMLLQPDFVQCTPKTNHYHSLQHKEYGAKLRMDFRKAVEKGKVIGYGHLEISISPHYHFNEYKHNGNDLTPKNSIKTVLDILTYLGLKRSEYDSLRVTNIEFGLNINPQIYIENLVNGLLLYSTKAFIIPIPQYPYSKITNTSKFKQVKAYAKGLQFLESPQFGINPDTFRFEVKTKESRNIKKYGIDTASDLLKIDTYYRLGQELLDEWEKVLLTNNTADLSDLNLDEIDFIQNANKFDFWTNMQRVKFARSKEKYLNVLGRKNNLHILVKIQIIDKLFSFQDVTFSTQKTPMDREKEINSQLVSH